MARYAQTFKNKAVARLLPPESAGLELVARETGVGVGTIERWQAEMESGSTRKQAQSAPARLDAVIATAAMNETAPKPVRPPTTHIAAAPRQVWCWDMTYLPAEVVGRWFHLYLILDLYSRTIVGWEVHDTDHADHAVLLVRRTALAEGIAELKVKPVLHGDNGATLKALTVLATLYRLGVAPSYSRPRVSDDNAYAESLFRTAK